MLSLLVFKKKIKKYFDFLRDLTNFSFLLIYNEQVPSLFQENYSFECSKSIKWRICMKRELRQKSLLILISIKRKDMYKKAKNLGFTHPIVVACSQELDQLLNKYQDKVS